MFKGDSMLKRFAVALVVFVSVIGSAYSTTLQEKIEPYFTGWWMDRTNPFHLKARFSNGVMADAYVRKHKTDDEEMPFTKKIIPGGEYTYIATTFHNEQSNIVRIDKRCSIRYDDFPDELISTFYGWTDAEWEANDLGSKMKSINDARSVLESYDIDLDYVPENMVRLYNFPANCIVFDESISIPLDDSRINIYYDVESDEFSYQMKNIRNLNGITDWENRIKWNLSKDNTHFLSKSRGNLVFPSSTYKYMDGDEQVRAGYVSFFEIGDENFMVYCENSNYDLDLGYNPEIIGLSLKWIRRI